MTDTQLTPPAPAPATCRAPVAEAALEFATDAMRLWESLTGTYPAADEPPERLERYAARACAAAGYFATAFLLRRLADVDAQAADLLQRLLQDGEAAHDLTWEWLVDAGLDPDHLPEPSRTTR
jgi:hypothetical protein